MSRSLKSLTYHCSKGKHLDSGICLGCPEFGFVVRESILWIIWCEEEKRVKREAEEKKK